MIKKIFLAEDKFMPEMHLRQRGFMYSARRPFKQKKENFETLPDKTFAIARSQQYDGFHRGLVHSFLIKRLDILLMQRLEFKFLIINNWSMIYKSPLLKSL